LCVERTRPGDCGRGCRLLHAILAPVHCQTITVSSSLFGIFDVRWIPFQNGNFIRISVLAPVSGAALARLNDNDVVLSDRALDSFPSFCK